MQFGLERERLLLVLAILFATAAIAAAWSFEIYGGYAPCALCLRQRLPYYLGIPLFLIALISPRIAKAPTIIAAVAFIFGGALGMFQSGAEWKWWDGPSQCGGAPLITESAEALLAQIAKTRVVSCSDAPWRFLGLSFAGWNAVVSFCVAGLAFASAAGNRHRQAAEFDHPRTAAGV